MQVVVVEALHLDVISAYLGMAENLHPAVFTGKEADVSEHIVHECLAFRCDDEPVGVFCALFRCFLEAPDDVASF